MRGVVFEQKINKHRFKTTKSLKEALTQIGKHR